MQNASFPPIALLVDVLRLSGVSQRWHSAKEAGSWGRISPGHWRFSSLMIHLRSPVVLLAVLLTQAWGARESASQTAPTQPPFARNPGGGGMFGTILPGGRYPAPEYYTGLEFYRAGELDRAAEMFDSALHGSRLDAKGRWIDAIPALAMLGECYWHLGDLQQAKLHQDKVFEILIKHRGWLGRTDWTSLPSSAVRQTPMWLWKDAKNVPVLSVANRVPFRAGDKVTAQRLARGGTIEEESIRQIDVTEIMRGVCIASFRRRLIIGALSANDRMSEGALESTKYPTNLNLPIGRSMIGAMRTSGHFTNGDRKRVIEEANATAFIGGRAHPMTPITMLTKAWTITGEAKPNEVADLASRIANVSAALGQPEWIGEAMQLAAGSANQQNAATVAMFSGQIARAYLRRSRLTALHCLIAAADASITAGNLSEAGQFLKQALVISSRRDVVLPRLQAYGAFVSARLATHSGASIGSSQKTEADVAIQLLRKFALDLRSRRNHLISIPKLFQITWIRSNFGAGWGGRSADAILQSYTENPTASDWQRDPVDAMGMIMSDRSMLFQARAELAASGNYADALLVRVNEMLAYRFLHRLPLGGRICNLRVLSERPDEFLSSNALRQREEVGQPMVDLISMTGQQIPNDANVAAMESKVSQLALSRISVPPVALPEILKNGTIEGLPDRTGLLVFVTLNNQVHVILGTNQKLTIWKIANAKRLSSEVSRLLKAIGVGKGRGKRIPEQDSWKKLAMELRKRLFPDDQTVTSEKFDRLLIVPDGPLWYLPFEILPLGDPGSDGMQNLIAIKYAPTPGAALFTMGGPAANQSIGLTGKQFFNVRDPQEDALVFETVVDSIETPVRLPDDLEVSTGWLGDHVGHLAVAHINPAQLKNPLAMSVAPYDASSPSGRIDGWLRYPPRAPASLIMMGTRTPVGVGQMGDGNEIFLTLTAFHVAGTRDVLMSRWAVGGESSATLLREIMQELPFEGLENAWKRARQVLQTTPLDPSREPLLSRAESELENLTGSQPLFWAGYLLSGGQ